MGLYIPVVVTIGMFTIHAFLPFCCLTDANHYTLSPAKGEVAAAAAKSLQSCLTLCDTVDSSPPGFSFHGILQARIMEWIAMPSF